VRFEQQFLTSWRTAWTPKRSNLSANNAGDKREEAAVSDPSGFRKRAGAERADKTAGSFISGQPEAETDKNWAVFTRLPEVPVSSEIHTVVLLSARTGLITLG
jgi:hypothetical protein